MGSAYPSQSHEAVLADFSQAEFWVHGVHAILVPALFSFSKRLPSTYHGPSTGGRYWAILVITTYSWTFLGSSQRGRREEADNFYDTILVVEATVGRSS